MRTERRTGSHIAAILLACAAFAAPLPAARAETIGDEAVLAGTPADADRAKVRAFLERADLRERLQAMGVSGLAAGRRVDALTDAEVHALAERIDAMPAGGALSDRDILIIILIAVIIAIII